MTLTPGVSFTKAKLYVFKSFENHFGAKKLLLIDICKTEFKEKDKVLERPNNSVKKQVPGVEIEVERQDTEF